MTPQAAREVSAYLFSVISSMRTKYAYLPLNHHDWDDIRQEILIHVAAKWHMCNSPKWRAWVKTIVRNQFKNQIRDRVVKTCREGYRVPLLTRSRFVDEFGNLAYEYEPDVIAQKDMLSSIYEAIGTLNANDQRIFDLLLKRGSWTKVRRSIKMSNWRFDKYRANLCRRVRKVIKESS